MIQLKDIVLLGLFPMVMSIGQILFRTCAVAQTGKGMKASVIGLLTSPTFFLACAFYIAATGYWIWLLTRYPLSVAYPIAILSVVFTPLIDKYFFKCQLSGMYWIGLSIMVFGVFIIVRSTQDIKGGV